MEVLHKKSGSVAPLRVFRAAVRKMVAAANMPYYRITVQDADDMVVFIREAQVVEPAARRAGPVLVEEVFSYAHSLMPGADVCALRSEWRSFWECSGRLQLQDPDKVFAGWLAQKAKAAS